jgi:hypothetical protein
MDGTAPTHALYSGSRTTNRRAKMPQGPAPTKGTYALIDANHFYVSFGSVPARLG